MTLADGLYGGVEISRRDYDRPSFSANKDKTVFQDQHENHFSSYINWTPFDDWALIGQVQYEHFDFDGDLSTNVPNRLRSLTIPLAVRYFSPLGFFAGVGGTYVYQDVNYQKSSTLKDFDTRVVLVDAAVGYRMPHRRGLVSLMVTNLFDQSFNYQDNGFREFAGEPSVSPYLPERTILVRLTLNF